MRARIWLMGAALATATGLGCGGDTVVSSGGGEDLIRVSGSATVDAAPDVASATVGVSNFDADAVAAVTDNNVRTAAVTAALEGQGVDEDDLRTTGFSVSPQRAYREDRPDSVTGFWVNNRILVTIRDLNNVGTVLQVAIDAGANEVNGLQFTLSKPDSIENLARELAVVDARRRAEVLAAAAGVRVGRVISLSESSASVSPIFRGGFEADQASSVPIQPGEVEVTARVEAVFSIKD